MGSTWVFLLTQSSQAIAYFELQKTENKEILKSSAALSHKLMDDFEDTPLEQLAVEICVYRKVSPSYKPGSPE